MSISIHALLAESDFTLLGTPDTWTISIHALLAESDKIMVPVLQTPRDFYPRSPCGERPCTSICRVRLTLFLSTLSLRRATVWPHQRYFPVDISIHALLAESDAVHIGPNVGRYDFYPRSPCGERPGCRQPCARPTKDFYPRSPCGERPTPSE